MSVASLSIVCAELNTSVYSPIPRPVKVNEPSAFVTVLMSVSLIDTVIPLAGAVVAIPVSS